MHKYMNLFFYNIVDNMYKFKITLISLLLCLLTMGAQAQLKPRVVILTDIGQPDSRQSEVLYGFLNVTLFSCN